MEAIAALEASGMQLARALDVVTPERGAGHGHQRARSSAARSISIRSASGRPPTSSVTTSRRSRCLEVARLDLEVRAALRRLLQAPAAALQEQSLARDPEHPRGLLDAAVSSVRGRGGPGSARARRRRRAAAGRAGRASRARRARRRPGSCAARPGSPATAARASRRVRLGEGDDAPHFVGELADVARPRVEQQVFERFVAERDAALVLLVAELLQVVLEQRRNLLAPLAQRRQVERQDLEAVEQVLAEAAVAATSCVEVGVGGGDDADVDLDGAAARRAGGLLLLDEAQQLGLEVEADVADLVEEERAAVGGADDAREARTRRR